MIVSPNLEEKLRGKNRNSLKLRLNLEKNEAFPSKTLTFQRLFLVHEEKNPKPHCHWLDIRLAKLPN